MRRMYIGAGEDDASAAARFARSVHASWGVGSAACNNGVLLLLATDDRQVYISTGTGAEARLPRPVLLAVMGNMKPALRERRYDEALLEAVHEIGLGLAGADVPGAGDEGGSGVFMFFASVVAAVFGWGWWSNRRQMARYKTCHNRLEALKRDQAALQRGQYASTSCPICLEDFDDAASGGGASTSDAARAGGAEAAGESAPLLASRGDAAAVAGGGDAKGHRPLALRCGHAFCVPCISEWVRGHTTCPVCRRDIDAPDGTSRTPPPPRQPCGDATATAAAQQAGVRARGPARRDIFLPELMFRTQRLRLLYPDYVSDTMAAQFLQDLEEDRPLSPAAFASFEARHPARDAAGRAELRESGRGGASTSFGGGSGGGGGAGSSW
ncbi:MAG: TLP18.3, Psb32 and MOLO-1 founding proteins of phosphatase-domain-containing protein [Monoraphidium minutum]|nr:MAG: TLP18.3, Psb32 and MOLO-1 founding proteins of phosphatase-domain-containing protein [Monoraphidium minutum]